MKSVDMQSFHIDLQYDPFSGYYVDWGIWEYHIILHIIKVPTVQLLFYMIARHLCACKGDYLEILS